MAEELFDHDDYEPQSPLSGELGSLSTTWQNLLGSGNGPAGGGSGSTLDAYRGRTGSAATSYSVPPAPTDQAAPGSGLGVSDSHPGISGPLREGRTLFEQRYDPGAMSSSRLRRNRPSPRERFIGSHADLGERQLEDRCLTGRRWPGNGLAGSGTPHEALYLDQLAITLGEVDPRVLARESALHYVRASRLPGKDDLGPTDIHAIFYYGLGLSLRPLNCAATPQVLATYIRLLHEVYIDWTLVEHPPYGLAVLDQSAWRRTIDNSPLARILLAWCTATHLTESYGVPLVLGFSELTAPPADSRRMPPSRRNASISPGPGMAGDVVNRYRKTTIAFATLLAPQERLWQQIHSLRLGVHMGDPEWRARVRSLCSLEGSGGDWRQVEVAGHLTSGQGLRYPYPMDPVKQLISVLAERNNCPRGIIEWQLDGGTGVLDWDSWSRQLLRDVPALAQRYSAAERFLCPGRGAGGGGRDKPQLPGEPALRLSL